MSISELCNSYVNAKLRDETERNIIEFAEAPWGLGLGFSEEVPPLFPVQKFIFKCYYNIPLDDGEKNIIVNDRFNEKLRYRFNEVEYLSFLWNEGRINIKEVTGNKEDLRPNLVLVIGRRGLKTSSIAVLVAYETYKLLRKFSPQMYYRIMPDDEIRVSCIATNQEQATQLFGRITGHLERSEFFKKYRNKPTLNYMQLNTQRDIETYGPVGKISARPSIRIVAAPCSGRGLRGPNNIIAILDEMAYFFESESSHDKSDRQIYDAVTPSVARFNSADGTPHGRVICISSPASRSGKFFELYQRSLEPDCGNILMIKAPSWEVDYTLSPQYLRSKYSENPISYDAEFGGNFSDRISAWIDNEQVLRMNVVPGLRLKQRSYERIPHFMGVDVGLKGDGTAIAICHIVKKEMESGVKEFIELDEIAVRYATDEDKEYFHPEDMANWIASYTEKFFIVKGMLDQYYGMSMMPVLVEKGCKQIQAIHMSRDLNSKIYQNLMSKMLDSGLRIPEGEERIDTGGAKTRDLPLLQEMLRLQAVQHSKYMISVKAPEIKGIHDDLSDAYARAVYLATEYMSTGGGISKSLTAQGRGGNPNLSYKRYLMKQRKSAMYTNRPSSGLMAEMSSGKHFGHLNQRSRLGR